MWTVGITEAWNTRPKRGLGDRVINQTEIQACYFTSEKADQGQEQPPEMQSLAWWQSMSRVADAESHLQCLEGCLKSIPSFEV